LISLRDFVQPLWKRVWVIGLTIVLIVGLAVGSSFLQTPQYEASIEILIGQQSDADPAFAPTVLDLQQLTLTMAQAVESRPVAAAAIRSLDLSMTPENLVANLNAEAIEETQFIRVAYVDSDPQRAQRVVNAVGDAFSERVSSISPSANAVSATVWEKAAAPEAPVSPNPARRAFLALVMGALIGMGLALLLEATDDRWHSPEEAERISGVPTLGVIPAFSPAKTKRRRGA
jgi:capsular polysaccharide biosynthesis protein